MIRVGLLGLARREGTFAEVGLRSWEEAGCAAVERVLVSAGRGLYVVRRPLVIRSARGEIERILRDWCDVPNEQARCDVILTVGGTGYSEKDVIPEVTLALIQRAAPGITQVLRRVAFDAGQMTAAVSRGEAGLRGKTLLINLPGIAEGLADQESLTLATQTLLPLLPNLLPLGSE